MDVPGGDGQTTVERVLKRVNIPMETLDDEEFRRRYPMLRYSKSVKGTLERFGGILLADKARQCLQVRTRKSTVTERGERGQDRYRLADRHVDREADRQRQRHNIMKLININNI